MKTQQLRKFVSVFLAIALMFTILPGGLLKASAASTLSINQTVGTSGYTQDGNGNITISKNGDYTITGDGSATTDTVTVTGCTANITIDNVYITPAHGCPFELDNGASVNLTLTGTNTLDTSYRSRSCCAGLSVNAGNTLSISGTGSLLTKSGISSAGIGGTDGYSCGIINISGGTVNALGNIGGAGIGGGTYTNGGTVNISGGTVTATSGNGGAGIGGGSNGNGGTVNISGGTVTATIANGGGGAGIGGGGGGAGGAVNISGGTVTAAGGSDDAGNAAPGIGGGIYGDAGTTVITGGSVNSTVQGTVTDGSGHTEYCVTTDAAAIGPNKTVTGSVNNGPSSDMQTGANSKLYFWMPTTGSAAVKSGGNWYSASVSGISHSATATLKAIQSLDIATGSITIADNEVTQGSNNYSTNDCVITQSGSGSTPNTVSVTGGTHCVVLKGVDIENSSGCAFGLSGSSTVSIALCGDNTLTSGSGFAGIQVPTGSSIAVAGSDSDSLTVTGGNASGGGAGIGGGGDEHDYCGSITVNGGKVTATGGISPNKDPFGNGIDGGAGIGGGMGSAGGNITINGGTVVAVGKNDAAGIGGGYQGSGGTVTINGGSVKANGSIDAAGIGGSVTGSGGTVTINAGNVNAVGSNFGAGIGGGYQGNGGTVNVKGGKVTANGGERGAGIGGGNTGSGGTVTITGGITTATGKDGGAGIGGGADKDGGTINISGGTVTATGNTGGAGIGAGTTGNGCSVLISGGLVTANGGSVGAGIGGGYNGSSGIVTISGGLVHATGGNGMGGFCGAAGIGGGSCSTFTAGSSDTVKISGGTVTAKGGSSSNDIGSGSSGNCGAVIMTGGSVIASKISHPTNGTSTPANVYLTTVSVPDGTNVNALAVNQGGSAYAYGCKDMQTDAASYGKLYLWLPANATTADVTTESGSYSGYYGTVDTTGASVLKMDQNLVISGITDSGSYAYENVPAATVSAGAPGMAATVTYSGTDTVANSTITNSLTQPKDVGNYTVTATKAENDAYYSGTKTVAFTITPKNVTDDTNLNVTIPDQTYSGGELTPSPVSVKDGSTSLTANVDYTVLSYSNNTNAGLKTDLNPPTATVTYKGNYIGTKAAAFTIKPKDVTNDTDLRINIPDQTYTGSAITPDPTVTDGNTVLTANTDYSVSDSNNINAAQESDTNPPTAIITFKGNYTGTKSAAFTINKKSAVFSLNVGTPGQTYAAGENIPLSVTITGTVNQPVGTVTFTCDGRPFASSSNVPIQTANGAYMASINWTAIAGTHNFKAIYNPAPSGENYTFADAEIDNFTVGKKMQAALSISNTDDYTVNNGVISKTLDDGAFTLNVTGGSGNGALSFAAKDANGNPSNVVSVDADGKVTILNAGTATITVTKAADATYNVATTTVSITVNPASQSGFAITGGPGYTIDNGAIAKTFGDSAFTLQTTGGNGTGAVSFTASGNAVSVDQNGHVTIQGAGISTITATKEAQGNYLPASASVTVNVGKATTSVTAVPAASDISVIGKLSASNLTGGSGSVAGSFAWTNPDAVVSSSGQYDVTFTPTDSSKYSTATCKVNLAVTPLLTNSQSNISLDLSGVTLPAGVTSVSLGSIAQSSSSDTYSTVVKLIGQNQTLGNVSGLTVYDLKLLDQNGNPIKHFTGKIKVKIPIPAGMNGNLKVLWYNPADGTLTDMNAVQENGYFTFETSHFSYYAIAQLGSRSSSSSSPMQNPQTGSGNWPLFPLAILGGSAATGAVIMKRRRFFRVKKQSK